MMKTDPRWERLKSSLFCGLIVLSGCVAESTSQQSHLQLKSLELDISGVSFHVNFLHGSGGPYQIDRSIAVAPSELFLKVNGTATFLDSFRTNLNEPDRNGFNEEVTSVSITLDSDVATIKSLKVLHSKLSSVSSHKIRTGRFSMNSASIRDILLTPLPDGSLVGEFEAPVAHGLLVDWQFKESNTELTGTSFREDSTCSTHILSEDSTATLRIKLIR